MANLPEGLAQFEYQKMQLIGSLGAVADTMRNCATIADQFAQLVSHVPYNPMLSNGQFSMAAAHSNAPIPSRGKRKASEDVEGRRIKKPRKPKDPNAPKRPASSYLLFQNEVRQELKAKNPTLPNNELLGLIAKMWKDMPKSERDEYETRQRAAKDQWVADKTAYKASLAPDHEESEALPSPAVDPSVVLAEKAAASGLVFETSVESSDDEESSSGSSRSSEEPGTSPKKMAASSSKGHAAGSTTNAIIS